jgi:hypothetical protein
VRLVAATMLWREAFELSLSTHGKSAEMRSHPHAGRVSLNDVVFGSWSNADRGVPSIISYDFFYEFPHCSRYSVDRISVASVSFRCYLPITVAHI